MNNFLDYLKEVGEIIHPIKVQPIELDWREARVWHTTPGGKRTYVKVKSLSPEEQKRYNPKYNKLKDDEDEEVGLNITPDIDDDELQSPYPIEGQDEESLIPVNIDDIEHITTDQFYKVYFPDGINRKFNIGIIDPQIMSMVASDGSHTKVVLNVPINAFIEYMNDVGDWTEFEHDMDLLDKADIINDNKFFQIYLKPFEEIIKVESA